MKLPRSTPLVDYPAPPGTHTIKVVAPDGREGEAVVDLAKGETRTVVVLDR